MEQKTNPGQQAEPQEAPKSTPWVEKFKELVEPIAIELDQTKDDRRGFMLVVVDTTPIDEGKYSVTMGAISGGTIPLGMAMKHVLTTPSFAPYIAHAAQVMAKEAATKGAGTIVIHAGDFDEEEGSGDDNQEPEENQEGAKE